MISRQRLLGEPTSMLIAPALKTSEDAPRSRDHRAGVASAGASDFLSRQGEGFGQRRSLPLSEPTCRRVRQALCSEPERRDARRAGSGSRRPCSSPRRLRSQITPKELTLNSHRSGARRHPVPPALQHSAGPPRRAG